MKPTGVSLREALNAERLVGSKHLSSSNLILVKVNISKPQFNFMMINQTQECLTERHLQLFGTIVQWFGRYEWLMQEVMATVVSTESASIMLLTRGLDFGGKLRALLELLRHRSIPLDQFDRINEYLAVTHTFMQLRDDIIHSTWVPSTTTSWVQPDWILRLPRSIKPLKGIIGSKAFIELERDKVEFSLDDLAEISETLATNYKGLFAYLVEVRLIER